MSQKFVNGDNLKRAVDYIKNGTIEPARAVAAKTIDPLSQDSGSTQETPFINQATGTENNTTETPVSPTARQLEKQGNTVVINQLIRVADIQPSDTVNGITITNNGNGTITVNGTATADIVQSITYQITAPLNHKLYIGKYDNFYLYNGYIGDGIGGIFTNAHDSGAFSLYISISNGTTINSKTIPVIAVDLTQWFGSNDNIPAYLLSHPETFGNYYQGSLAYNTGTIVDCDGRYLVCGQSRNLWDEEWELGRINTSTGENQAATDGIRSKNYITVIPNAQYYCFGSFGRGIFFYDKDKNYIDGSVQYGTDVTITAPSNARYMRFALASTYGTVYKNDITISEYFTTGTDYNQYYPYVASKTYDTGSEVLLAFDKKTPDGTIYRNTGKYTFTGEETWTIYDDVEGISRFRCSMTLNVEKDNPKVIADKLVGSTLGNINNNALAYAIAIYQYNFWVSTPRGAYDTTTIKAFVEDIIVEYEKTPTTESGTPFADVIEVNDYGFMAWLDTSENYVITPQGCKIFYPADYVLLLDDLGQYTDYDVAALALKSEVQSDLQTLDDTKANKDGNYPTMTVGMADNLTPYDESAGDDQDEPFSFQATGTANGSQADFATGSNALLKEKQGNTVVVNQQFNNNLNSFSGADLTISVADNVLTGTLAATTGSAYMGFAKYVENHKFLFIVDTKQDESGIIKIGTNLSGVASVDINDTVGAWITSFCIITTINVDQYAQININARDKQIGDKFYIRNLNVIDLTQWFGSNDNIPADLLSHPENWHRYYTGSLAYNTGELVNANSRYIKCIGRQQWDEEWELGDIDNDGQPTSSNDTIRSKNFIKVIPNSTIYYKGTTNAVFASYDKDKNFLGFLGAGFNTPNSTIIISSDVCFLKFRLASAYGTTYNHDITISIYYSGESGYDQYYAYEVLTNNDTGTEILLAYDYKTPDGTIYRNTGKVDLGTLNWTYTNVAGARYGFVADLTNLKYTTSGVPKNLISEKYIPDSLSSLLSGTNNAITTATNDNDVIIFDSSYTDAATFKTAMSGVYLEYELATPTTESGTPFSENLIIDDFGSMEFAGTSGVPQGNLIFYPVDYKAFVDTLYDYTEGTPSDIQLKSDLSTAITTFLTGLTGYDATKTQVLKNVEGTLTWVDEEA